MGLLGDIEEVKKVWKKSSWSFKVFIVFVSIFTFSPIASLADILFEYKGFILDAILFYRTYVTQPLKNILQEFNLVYNEGIIDVVVFTLIITGSTARLILYKEKRKKKTSNKFSKLFFFLFISVVFPFGFATIVLYITRDLKYVTPFFTATLSFGLMSIYIIMVRDFMKNTNMKEKMVFYTPIIFSIAAVLILGAINNFLSR